VCTITDVLLVDCQSRHVTELCKFVCSSEIYPFVDSHQIWHLLLKQSSQRRLLRAGLLNEPNINFQLLTANINVLKMRWQRVPDLWCHNAESVWTKMQGPGAGVIVVHCRNAY